MKVAIDTSPISKSSNSAHKVRGVGMYINFLVENLPKVDRENKYIFVEDGKFPKDVDLIHYPYFDPFFRTLPLRSNCKFVVTVHDLTPLVFPAHFPSGIRGKINWQIQKSLLKKASMVIADSNCSKKDIERLAKVNPDKIKTVYLAADDHFKILHADSWVLETRRDFSLPEDFLLYVGDATWNKNLPGFIDAVKKTNYKVVMVGKVWPPARTPGSENLGVRRRAFGPEGKSLAEEVSNNPWNNDLKTVLKKIEGDDQFIKLGFVEDEEIVEIYNLATALILPSVYEGFGLPLLEAMQSGTPVISSLGGSLPEIGGDSVWYMQDLDSENIKLAIEKVMGDGALRAELSSKGLEQAKKFSAKKSIEELVGVYKSILI